MDNRLQSLNSDALSSIEDFLDVKSILRLTETSSFWHARWKWRWKWFFHYRWGKIQESSSNSPKWLSQVFLADFWHNVEAALLGLSSVSGNYDDDVSETTWFEALFIIFQPGFLQTVGRQMKPLLRSLTVTSLNYWKYVCVLRGQACNDGDVIACEICKQLDIKTQSHKKLEKLLPNVSWISPCVCRKVCHNTCLEKILNDDDIGKKSLSLDDPDHLIWLAQRPLHVHPVTCPVCRYQFKIGVRLPSNAHELIQVTLKDEYAIKRAMKCLLIWISLMSLFSVLSSSSSSSSLFDLWLLEQVILLDIFFSDRFMFIVRHLWRGPVFNFYCKLYGYFALACFFIFIIFQPIIDLKIPLIITLLGAINWAVYVVIGSMVIIIWWRTNYRIVTVLDRSSIERDDSHPIFIFERN